MLGMSVESYTSLGTCNAPDEPGELVCVKPFPCMPLGFWPLPGFGTEAEVSAAQVRFQQSYFADFEGVWCEYDYFILFSHPSRDRKIMAIISLSLVPSAEMEVV
jgi:acetoacetyl-CoA synthetase